MNAEIIKPEKINRDSLDLDSVLIDEIKDKPTKIKESTDDEKKAIETITLEEAINFKRKKELQKAKKESYCYRLCNCNCCCNQKHNDNTDDCCDDIFWYWYFSNNNKLYSNEDNSNNCSGCQNEDNNCYKCMVCIWDCICDIDCDDD